MISRWYTTVGMSGVALILATSMQSQAVQALAVSDIPTPGFCFEGGITMGKYQPGYQQTEKDKASKRKYYLANKEKVIARSKKWKSENPDKVKQCNANYYINNKEKVNKRILACMNKRYASDLGYRVSCVLRARIKKAVVRGDRVKRTMELLGCSIEYFIKYLESNWKEGMNWNNYGYRGWHIDHIVPVVSFDLTCPEQQKVCFNYTNMQPLWAEENFAKERARKSLEGKKNG